MNFNSIFIITYGRSGSTLLQGILNSIDGCIIRGENNNLCYHLFNAWQSIVKSKMKYAPSAQNPWYGSHMLNEKLFLSNCRNLLYVMITKDESHLDSLDCYGFKEIRYTVDTIGNDLEKYLGFLERIFPRPAFIFNTRNLNNVAKSEWWALENQRDVIEMLQKTEETFRQYLMNNPQISFHITYEDVVGKTERLRQLFDFIGAEYDVEIIDGVLSKSHSYKTI